MGRETIDWKDGAWSNDPKQTELKEGQFIVKAKPQSDYWQKTLYGFQRNSGHSLLHPFKKGKAMEVTFSLAAFTEQYDQAGIMLWLDKTHWVKAGIEMSDGVPHVGAVVTNEFSDWSLAPVPEWENKTVTIRASFLADALVLRARVDKEGWRTIRVAPFPYTSNVGAGPFLCSPERDGFRVTFSAWNWAPEDEGLHVDPPL